ncbi:hypothetical protein Rctr71_074 [Virus Rctr71]|nr:hypothetical protein Rctr71_074 [Virus Rctr71]
MSLMGFDMVVVDSEPVTLAVMVDDEGNEVSYALTPLEEKLYEIFQMSIESRINSQVLEVA